MAERIVQVHRAAARQHEDVTDAAVRKKSGDIIRYLQALTHIVGLQAFRNGARSSVLLSTISALHR